MSSQNSAAYSLYVGAVNKEDNMETMMRWIIQCHDAKQPCYINAFYLDELTPISDYITINVTDDVYKMHVKIRKGKVRKFKAIHKALNL